MRSCGTRSPVASIAGPTVTVASTGKGAIASRMFCSIRRCPAKAHVLRLTKIRGTGAGTVALGTPCQTTPVWHSLRRAAHRVEIRTGGDDLQRRRAFGTKRIDAAQPKKPAERARGHVLDPSIEAVHEDDCRDA